MPFYRRQTEMESPLTNITCAQTDFLKEHPGGPDVLLQLGGSDGTTVYDQYHHPGLVGETLSAEANIGHIEPGSVPQSFPSTTPQARSAKPETLLPPLNSILNLDEIEKIAEKILAPNAWAYYASAADDEVTKEENRSAYQRVMIRPRLLRDVEVIDTRTAILGYPCSLPIFVAPAALAKLGHPEGECALAAGAGYEDLIQVVSTVSSWPIEAIMAARVRKDQPVFFQLYVNKNRKISEALIRKAENVGVKAIWVTIDSPVMGKREQDERVKTIVQVC